MITKQDIMDLLESIGQAHYEYGLARGKGEFEWETVEEFTSRLESTVDALIAERDAAIARAELAEELFKEANAYVEAALEIARTQIVKENP